MNKYFQAIFGNFITLGVSTIFFLLIIPIAMRVMGSEFYGLWSILYAIIQIAGVGTAGTSSIVNKFASETNSNKNEYFGEIIAGGIVIVLPLACITAVILLIAKGPIVDHLTFSSVILKNQFGDALLIIALSLVPQFMSRVYQGFLLSQVKHYLTKQIDLYYNIALWGGMVLLSFLQKNLVIIAVWCLITSFLSLVAYMVIAKRVNAYNFSINLQRTRKMLNFSVFLFWESLAIGLFQQMDTVLVGMVLGPSLAGIYSVGTSLSVRLSSVAGQITEVMIPYASLKNSLSDHERLFSVFRKLSHYVSLLVALMGVAVILWMNELLSVWISPDYALRYSNYYRILIIAYNLLSLSRPAHQTLMGMGKVKITSTVYTLSTTLFLTFLYFFSKQIGLLGAVLADCVMFLLLFYNIYTYHLLKSPTPWWDFLSDLGYGLFLPIIVCSVLFIFPNIEIKIILSILFIAMYAYVYQKDAWLKSVVNNVINTIRHRKSA